MILTKKYLILESMAFYRKYRPQSLSELVGQEQVKQSLTQAFLANRLSHAYLFCGPRGTGKTSTARILAKMVNCEKPSTEESQPPCNKCDSCISITDGSNLDLIEIDAASNRGIDDIRELRDKIKLSPLSSKKKVYIIDEVHMLTTEAFNALLKTLEEPPEHVLFILATTELNKVPQTILSRVQKFNFQLAKDEDIILTLKKIAEEEKIDIEENALSLIAKKGEGSFRDSQKLLDQLASRGEKITTDLVSLSINSGSLKNVLDIIEKISNNNSNEALKLLSGQLDSGVSAKELAVQILEVLRGMLLRKHQKEIDLGNFDQSYSQELTSLSTKFTSEKLIALLENFQKSLEQIKYTSIPSLPLEIAVIESCLTRSTQVETTREIVQEKVVVVESAALQADNNPTIPVQPIATDSGSDLVKLSDKWTYILETIRPYNYSLEALLKQAKVVSCEEGIVCIEVPYSFHQRILDAPKSRSLLESVFADVLSKPVKVNTALGNRPIRVEELANIEIAADDEIVKIASEIFNS